LVKSPAFPDTTLLFVALFFFNIIKNQAFLAQAVNKGFGYRRAGRSAAPAAVFQFCCGSGLDKHRQAFFVTLYF